MATLNDKISDAVTKFGKRVVENKIDELFSTQNDFVEFSTCFESVFQTNFKNIHSIKIENRNKYNEKNLLDKFCFIHLACEEYYYNTLKAIGYNRQHFYQANKTVKEFNERIPIHKEYIQKINQFKQKWEQKTIK
jgi:hypothetical protein